MNTFSVSCYHFRVKALIILRNQRLFEPSLLLYKCRQESPREAETCSRMAESGLCLQAQVPRPLATLASLFHLPGDCSPGLSSPKSARSPALTHFLANPSISELLCLFRLQWLLRYFAQNPDSRFLMWNVLPVTCLPRSSSTLVWISRPQSPVPFTLSCQLPSLMPLCLCLWSLVLMRPWHLTHAFCLSQFWQLPSFLAGISCPSLLIVFTLQSCLSQPCTLPHILLSHNCAYSGLAVKCPCPLGVITSFLRPVSAPSCLASLAVTQV